MQSNQAGYPMNNKQEILQNAEKTQRVNSAFIIAKWSD